MSSLTLQEIVVLLGIIFGVSGCVLGIANFLRDRPRVKITQQWDMRVTPNRVYDPNKTWGVISVTNAGRRPVYVSHVSLMLPRGSEAKYLTLLEAAAGTRLAEGDAPQIYPVNQKQLTKYARDWRIIVAQVWDSTGKTWKSKKLRKSDRPSWAKL